MVGLPAKCLNPRCGTIFEDRSLIGGSGSIDNLTITGTTVSCPKCGGRAAIGDGIYKYSNESFDLKHGPSLTREMITQLTQITDAIKTRSIKAEELLAEVADVSPELAGKLRERGLTYFGIALLLIWLLKSVQISINVDLNRLIDQVQGVTAEQNDQRVLDLPLPPDQRDPTNPRYPVAIDQRSAQRARQARRRMQRQSRKANRGRPRR